jgi:hypothetical protein
VDGVNPSSSGFLLQRLAGFRRLRRLPHLLDQFAVLAAEVLLFTFSNVVGDAVFLSH